MMKTSVFSKIPLFDGVGDAVLERLVPESRLQNVPAGQTVFDQGDDSRDVIFLLAGSLAAVYWSTEGREVVFTRFRTGSCLGELSAIDDQPRSLAIYATTDAQLLRFEQRVFLMLLDTVPLIRQRVLRDLVARVRGLTNKHLEHSTLSIEQRLCSYLTRMAIEKGKLRPGEVIAPAPTHAEIAGTIGANREVVSRTISRLVRRGVIKSGRQRIEIVDPARLTAAI